MVISLVVKSGQDLGQATSRELIFNIVDFLSNQPEDLGTAPNNIELMESLSFILILSLRYINVWL